VLVEALDRDGLDLRSPAPRNLAAGSRSLVRFEVTAHRPGVHDVQLQVTADDGTPLGRPVGVPVRATEVSAIIWIVMAGRRRAAVQRDRRTPVAPGPVPSRRDREAA
jgi:hypothetical protein